MFDAQDPDLYINSADKSVVQHGSIQLGNKSHVYIASDNFQAANPDGPKQAKLEAADYDFSALSPAAPAEDDGSASPGKRPRGGQPAAPESHGASETRVYTMWTDKAGVDGVFERCTAVGGGGAGRPEG